MRRITSILLLIALTLTSSGIAADLHRAQHVHAEEQAQPDARETSDCHCNHDHGEPAATDPASTVASHFDANHHADDHCQTCINLHTRAIQPSTPAADHSIADAGVAPCPFEAQVYRVPTTLQIDCTGPPGC